ncbi:MAG: hypothetical protein WC100_06185 [Sterolibacterium sp.]
MNSANKQAKRIAGFVAIMATVFTLGGTLALADHYSRSNLGGQDYIAAVPQSAPAVLKKAG